MYASSIVRGPRSPKHVVSVNFTLIFTLIYYKRSYEIVYAFNVLNAVSLFFFAFIWFAASRILMSYICTVPLSYSGSFVQVIIIVISPVAHLDTYITIIDEIAQIRTKILIVVDIGW